MVSSGIVLLALAAALNTFQKSVGDEPVKADLIVILGGGSYADRTTKGCEVFKAGFAQHVLLTGTRSVIAENSPDSDRRLQILSDSGVPSKAIWLNGDAATSWQEAVAVRALMLEKTWRRVLIVSDPPHLPRLRWVYDKVFRDVDLSFRVIGTAPEWWQDRAWWSSSKLAVFSIKELFKLIFYFVIYSHEQTFREKPGHQSLPLGDLY